MKHRVKLWLLLVAILTEFVLGQDEAVEDSVSDILALDPSTDSEDSNEPQTRILTPPSFNVAENRKVTVNATCGEGALKKEVYCKLVGYDRLDYASTFDILDGQVRTDSFFSIFHGNLCIFQNLNFKHF